MVPGLRDRVSRASPSYRPRERPFLGFACQQRPLCPWLLPPADPGVPAAGLLTSRCVKLWLTWPTRPRVG